MRAERGKKVCAGVKCEPTSLLTAVGAREFSKPVLSFEFSSDMEENARGSTSDTVKYTMDVVVPEVSKISKIRKILQN